MNNQSLFSFFTPLMPIVSSFSDFFSMLKCIAQLILVTKQVHIHYRVLELPAPRNSTIPTSTGIRGRKLRKNTIITCHPDWSWADLWIFPHWCNSLWFSDNLRQMHAMTEEILWTWYTAGLWFCAVLLQWLWSKQRVFLLSVVSAKHQGHLQSHWDLAEDPAPFYYTEQSS